MSIWGKLAGAAAGFFLGGPLGALAGALAGHVAIDRDGEPEPADDPRLEGIRSQLVFTIGVIALGAKMAKADGVVTRDEVDAFKEIFHVPPNEQANVRRVFNMARQSVAGYEAYAEQIARLFRGRPAVLEDLLDGLFHIAKADGVIHPNELAFLERVATIFGFSSDDWERIRSSHMGGPSTDPYTVLGVARDISDPDLKAAYRKLAREHHPDALRGRGVPEEFVTVAEAKLAAINDAYDRIRRQRGLDRSS